MLIPENDPVAIYEAAAEAVGRARRGGGPSLIEVKTDRLFGHFEGDPQVYRTKEEMALLQERDAVRAFERRLIDTGVLTTDAAQGAWDRARAEVDGAIEFARSSPYPEPPAALQHVFA